MGDLTRVFADHYAFLILLVFLISWPSNVLIRAIILNSILSCTRPSERKEVCAASWCARWKTAAIGAASPAFLRQREPGIAAMIYHEVIRIGAWTGFLERVIVLVLSANGAFSAVAWVMAAKALIAKEFSAPPSVGEKSREEVITKEVYVLGTFASFAVAILAGIVLRSVLGLSGGGSG